MKSYTDLEQSHKLAKILPLESADMCWYIDDNNIPTHTPDNGFYRQDKNHLPCWSLAALLDILHDYTLQTNTDGTVFVVCESGEPIISDSYNSPVDACVQMILKLL